MSARRSLVPLLLALFAGACSDRFGPPTTEVERSLAGAPHFLQWAGEAAPQFRVIGALPGRTFASAGEGVFASGPMELSLDQNTATFWVVRGEERSVQINYLSATGETSSPFLRLAIADPTYVPGYGDLAPGDSVLITVTIDPQDIKVSLEPTGLLFGDPARLYVSYSGADGDLNGDGVVDDTDAGIEWLLLGMWYREGPDSPWTAVEAVHSLSDKSFTSELKHFSEYAVSW